MLSISNVGGSQAAGQYYEKADDYYTQDKSPSKWQGSGGKALGLEGPVVMEDFSRLLDGNLPGGESIQTGALGHRGGTDLTFSAPKSLSMQAMIGGDQRLVEAHDRAVSRALAYAETLAAYRLTEQGQTKRVLSKNLMAATFRHELSRACDPQLHTHCVVLNLTQRPDGQWRAMDNELFYRQKMLMGALYRAELAREVQLLGYEVRRTRDDGLFELSHITDKQLREFSARSQVIEAALAQRGKVRVEASAQEKQILTLATRPKKTDVDRKILTEYWIEKSCEAAISYRIFHKALERKILKDHLAGESVQYSLEHNTERQAVITSSKLMRTALEQGVGRTHYEEIKKEIRRQVKLGGMIQSGECYTTPKAQWREREILASEKKGRGMVPPIYFKGDIFFELKNWGLNPGQREAATLILTTANRIVGVQGLAGTGKTFMLQAARRLAEAGGFQVRGLAPSAAAARELARTGMISKTLAAFEHSQTKDLHENTLLVVDESGMVSAMQMRSVLKASERAGARVVLVGDTQQLKAVEAGKPFAQLQDKGMETAGMGEIQRQKNPHLKAAVELAAQGRIFESIALMDQEIKVIKSNEDRYEEIAKGYLSLSPQDRDQTLMVSGTNAARKIINEQVRKKLNLSGSGIQIEILENKDLTKAEIKQTEKYAVGDYVKPHRKYRSLNLKNRELCKVVKVDSLYVVLEKANGNLLHWDPTRHCKFSVYKCEKRELTQGDKVRITENDRRLDLNNGDMARVKEIGRDQIRFEREDGKGFGWNISKPLHLEHGYCSTVHSAQGRTCERVLIEADVHSITSSKDTYYVALSRARREAKIYTNDRERLPEMMARENVKKAALEIHCPSEARINPRTISPPRRERNYQREERIP